MNAAKTSEAVLLRLEPAEKKAFNEAVAGPHLAAWIRERLRRVAIRELEKADLPIPFLRYIPGG